MTFMTGWTSRCRWASGGDNYDRFRVRIEEVKQSLRMVEQCADEIRPGPVRTDIESSVGTDV